MDSVSTDWAMVLVTIVIAFGTMSMASAAWMAYDSWKKQTKTKIELDFLDENLEAVHSFILSMHPIYTYIELIKMMIDTQSGNTYYDKTVTFLAKHGNDYGQLMGVALQDVAKHLQKLKYFSVKASVLWIEDYNVIIDTSVIFENVYSKFLGFQIMLLIENTANFQNLTTQSAIQNSIISFNLQNMKDEIEKSRLDIAKHYQTFYLKTLDSL